MHINYIYRRAVSTHTWCFSCYNDIAPLNFRLAEAETALSGNILTKAKTPEDIISEFGDSASYALSLLAQIYRYVYHEDICLICLITPSTDL